MYKKIELIFIVAFFFGEFSPLYSQDMYKPIDNREIKALDNRIIKLLKKSACAQSDSLKLIHVFLVSYEGDHNKNDFINGNFLKNISPGYFLYHSKKYLNTISFIFKNNGEFIAYTSGRYIYCMSSYKESEFIKLGQKMFSMGIENAYLLGLTPINTYFGVDKNRKVYIFQIKHKTIETYQIEDFPDKDWRDIFEFIDDLSR